MRRRLLITLLTLGTVGGYGSALAHAHGHAHAHRTAWEQHLARLCARAAKTPATAPQDDLDHPW